MAGRVLLVLVSLIYIVVPSHATLCPTACECSSWLGTYIACRGTTLSVVPINTYQPEIESLYFTYNKNMTVVSNGAFFDKNYSTLKDLILNNNAIHTIEPHAFAGLANIKQLDLSANDISVIQQEVFQPMKRLTRLNLFGNTKLILPENGWSIPRLALLILRGCGLQSIPDQFFERMPNLRIIKLDRNKFSEIDGNVFRPVLKNLKLLDLSINKFIRLPRTVLDVVPGTVELHLDHNRYTCDCNFVDSHCVYDRRVKTRRLTCKTPKKLGRLDGSDAKQYLGCGSEAPSCLPLYNKYTITS